MRESPFGNDLEEIFFKEMLEMILYIIVSFLVFELITRILLGIRFKMFGRKSFWEVIQYPIAVMDWRVFKGFGDIRRRASDKLFRFATQADEIGITAKQLQEIMAKANRADPKTVFEKYSGEHGFEKTYYRPFVGFSTRPNQNLSYVDIDHFGFQGVGSTIRKPYHTKRAIILGGSVAFGKGALSKAKNLTSKLEEFLNKKEQAIGSAIRWEVINLAFISSQSMSELNQAMIYAQLFSPDVIVQLSGINDLNFFLLKQKLYTYHWQDRVIDYLASPLWVKWLDQLGEYSFMLKVFRKILHIRPPLQEGQLYTVW